MPKPKVKKSSINIPEDMLQDIKDSLSLHLDGPQDVTAFIREAVAAKLARDRAKIAEIRKIREMPSLPDTNDQTD